MSRHCVAAKGTVPQRFELRQNVDKGLLVRLVLRGDRDFIFPGSVSCFVASLSTRVPSRIFNSLSIDRFYGRELQEYADHPFLFLSLLALCHGWLFFWLTKSEMYIAKCRWVYILGSFKWEVMKESRWGSQHGRRRSCGICHHHVLG